MPRTTRSAAKANVENGCTPKKGSEEERKEVRSSRKPKRAATPSRLNSTPAVSVKLDKNEHTDSVIPVEGTPAEDKIAGARMSGVKHSGLLAKDEEMR